MMKRLKYIFILSAAVFYFGVIYSDSVSDQSDFYFSVSQTIDYYNTDKCFGLLNYKVFFPENIGEKYNLKHVSMGLGLSRRITMERQKGLEKDMQMGIENNENFQKLAAYDPFREIGAFYSDESESLTVVVATMPLRYYEIVELKEIQAGNGITDIYQFTSGGVDYTWITYNDSGNVFSILSWRRDNIAYMIFALDGGELLQKTAVDISKEIIRFNDQRKSYN